MEIVETGLKDDTRAIEAAAITLLLIALAGFAAARLIRRKLWTR